MSEHDVFYNDLKNSILDTAPNVWEQIKRIAARTIAEQLVNELNGVPSKCGKLVNEQVNQMPIIGRVA